MTAQTAKMIARVNRSARSKYTFKVRQRLEDAQWEWELVSSNGLPLAVCPKPFSNKSLLIASIEKVRFAYADGRVDIQ
jgi:hypothetical protein